MTPAAYERELLVNLPARLEEWRREQGICPRCNGMTGIYVASNGGRTFVRCPECKGTGRVAA